MIVVSIGNPFEGVTLHGPFEDAEEASAYAELNAPAEDWHIVPVEEVS